jgi:hypothetical protein
MNKIALTILLLIASASSVFAQDKIYTTTQKAPIVCEVVEISVNEIKYHPVGRPVPIVSIDKQDVIRIVYASGEVFMVSNPLEDFSVYKSQKRWNAKLALLSPLLGHTQLFLEHSRKPGRSLEYELNLIGLGKSLPLGYAYDPGTGNEILRYADARGIGLGIGMKYLRLPDYVNGQVRLRHILQGAYIKPSISVAYYQRNFDSRDNSGAPFTTVRKPVYSAVAGITAGKQWILDNSFSLEFYSSVGFGADNVRSTAKKARNDVGQPLFRYDNEPFLNYGGTRFSRGDFGLVLGAGIRVGYLFNVRKKSDQPDQQ